MTPKESVTDRLLKLEVVEGVVPTPAVRSELLVETARRIRRNDISAAMQTAAEHIKLLKSGDGVQPAAGLLSGSHILREQVAGFAEAGINLFLAAPELRALPLSERAARGANGIVSRVLLSQQRISWKPRAYLFGSKKEPMTTVATRYWTGTISLR